MPPGVGKEPSRCENLPKDFPISFQKSAAGYVRQQPAYVRPKSPQELFKEKDGLKTLHFIRKVGEGFCVYPLKDIDGNGLGAINNGIVNEKFQKSLSLFGAPTHLVLDSDSLPPRGNLFDPKNNIFYGQDLHSLKWFVIGPEENFLNYLIGTYKFAHHLYSLWQENPLQLLLEPKWNYPKMAAPNSEPFPKQEAQKEIQNFLTWLKKNDHTLWKNIRTKVEYGPSMKYGGFMNYLACHSDLNEKLYAYYDPNESKIFLLPKTIGMLKRGEYEAASLVLSHEYSHSINFSEGFTVPSEQMASGAIELFLAGISQDSVWESLLVSFLGSFLFSRIQCNMVPLHFGEEAAAFDYDFSYSKQLTQTKSLKPYQKESQNYYNYIWETLAKNYPPEWTILAKKYFTLARSHNKIPARD